MESRHFFHYLKSVIYLKYDYDGFKICCFSPTVQLFLIDEKIDCCVFFTFQRTITMMLIIHC